MGTRTTLGARAREQNISSLTHPHTNSDIAKKVIDEGEKALGKDWFDVTPTGDVKRRIARVPPPPPPLIASYSFLDPIRALVHLKHSGRSCSRV